MKDKDKQERNFSTFLVSIYSIWPFLPPLYPAHQIKDSKEPFEVQDPIKRNIKTTKQLALFLVELTSNLARNQTMVICLIL